MQEEKIIGIVYRHDFNDYEITLMELDEIDEQRMEVIASRYDGSSSGWRDGKKMTIEDANVDYWESKWNDSYANTSDPKDVVSLQTIFQRYMDMQGTYKGFEEYVDSGFLNGNEKEYEKL